MLKIITLITLFVLNGCSALPISQTQLKSPNSASEQRYEHSLDSKTLNVRCSMPAFCCVQYESFVINGKESGSNHKSIVGLCVGI